MKKDFLPYDRVRNNAIRLAHKIYTDGFLPDIIYVSLRGGAYIGNLMSEYFKIVKTGERPVLYAAVVARSYMDTFNQEEIRIDGWTYDPQHLRQGDKILLVDDIFDSGKTINFLADVIVRQGIPREDLKIAVHDYKVFEYHKEDLPVKPDYYCRRHVIRNPEDNIWIHYMSHELVGLTPEELENYYLSSDAELSRALEPLSKR